MSDQQPQPLNSLPDDERITNDVRRDAEEAIKLYSAMQSNPQPTSGVFERGMLLRVEVQGSETPVLLLPEYEIVVGRVDPSSGDIPQLDLSPYAAYQMGISRRHAIIKWENDQLHLTDLGSRNGTFVNGKKAQPHQPLKLYDGDEMRLGKMSLRLHFRRKND